jgi:hypothetical protein
MYYIINTNHFLYDLLQKMLSQRILRRSIFIFYFFHVFVEKWPFSGKSAGVKRCPNFQIFDILPLRTIKNLLKTNRRSKMPFKKHPLHPNLYTHFNIFCTIDYSFQFSIICIVNKSTLSNKKKEEKNQFVMILIQLVIGVKAWV